MLLLLSHCAWPQPGWEELRFSFVLEYNGVEVPVEELRKGRDFRFEVEGEHVVPIAEYRTRFSAVEFPANVSDVTRHVDTLWLRISHKRDGVMEIGFPPRAYGSIRHAYLTDHMVVPFAPGRVMATDLAKELHVTGTMEGIGWWWNGRPSYSLSATCGIDTVRDVAVPNGGLMDFRIRCRSTRQEHGIPTTVLSFFTNGPYQPALRMDIRGSAMGKAWPLDTVRFAPSRFVFAGWHHLVADTSARRDTIFGWDRYGGVVHLSPAQPTANDSLRLIFWWLGGGENVRIDHHVAPDFEGDHGLVLTVNRSPVDIDMEAFYQAREIHVAVPPLPRGSYTVGLVYEEDPGFPAPRFDAVNGYRLQVR